MLRHRNLVVTGALALIASMTAATLAVRSLLIPSAPWGGAIGGSEGWPLLHNAPDRAFVDFELKWRGTLIQGEDWLPSKRRSRMRPWAWEHWAARRPSVYFVPPVAGDLLLNVDLGERIAGCTAVEIRLNDRVLTERALAEEEPSLEILLPANAVVAGVNRLQLVFDSSGNGRGNGALAGDQRVASFVAISMQADGVPPDASLELDGVSAPLPPDSPPHVFIYVVDALRFDAVHLGASSPTPSFARFAADALVFDRAWSPSSWTRPSTEALLTGRYAGGDPGRDDRGWVATAMAQAGYETLAISQSYVVDPERFGHGFATFYFSDALSRGTNEGQMASWFLWQHLAHRSDHRPMLTYIHTIDPHGPYTPYREDRTHMRWWAGWRPFRYDPPLVLRERRAGDQRTTDMMRDLYDGDVRHADRSFGAFLNVLRSAGVYQDSLVILTSDHGEGFGEHGTVGHGKSLYEDQVRVPLMVKLPGGRGAGTHRTHRVSTVAVAPTVFGAAGITAGDRFPTASLLDPSGVGDVVRSHFTRRRRQTGERTVLDAVAEGDLKCITTRAANGERVLEAYDLAADPGELQPLTDPVIRERCRRLLQPALESDRDGYAEDTVSEIELQRLQALGYVDQG